MPRQERPLDHGDSPLLRFAADLRQLRQKAGGPSYRQLALRAHASAASLSVAASGRRLPTLAVTIAYVEGCGGDVEAWRLRWQDVARTVTAGGAAAGTTTGAKGAVPAGSWAAGGGGNGVGTVAGAAAGAGGSAGAGAVPYPGTAAFGPGDAAWFFGREALTADLRERLRHRRVVTVTGPSGAGKTSLVNAGLIARLRAEGHQGPVVALTPGRDPLREADRWLAGPGAGSPAGPGEVIVVIDQFEELFTRSRPTAERLRFLDLLGAAATGGTPHRIVVCARADVQGTSVRRQLPSPAFFDDPLVVGPLAPEELRRAVTGPAALAGHPAEEDLVAVLVAAAAGQAGALPLVAAVLREAWLRREGDVLGLAALREAGGLDTMAARWAEAAWASLPNSLRPRARSLLLRLAAEPGPLALADLDHDPATRAVLERLARARVLTLDRGHIAWAHTAVTRTWPRLARWIDCGAPELGVHRRLAEAARLWQAHGRSPDRLYRGAQLTEARALFPPATREPTAHEPFVPEPSAHEPSAQERAFLDASLHAQRSRHRSTALTRTRLRAQHRLIMLLTATLAALTAAAPLALLR